MTWKIQLKNKTKQNKNIQEAETLAKCGLEGEPENNQFSGLYETRMYTTNKQTKPIKHEVV